MTQLNTDNSNRALKRPTIKLADDELVPRREFANEIGVTERTTQKMNLPTTYIGGMAYVARKASLQIVAGGVRRRNQPPKRRRAR